MLTRLETSDVAAGPTSQTAASAEIAFAYHARTKHDLKRYAAGPETLDWDAQPNPFREFAGCPRFSLPLASDRLDTSFAHLHASSRDAAPLTVASVATLLELSMGLAAWKEQGPDRWALRCNPSSGNLHPTEAYVISANVPGLEDGLYHYVSRDHVLEQRCRHTPQSQTRLWIGLSSIHWREAWKYGERAFRYCQLDLGHAIGAISYAAAALGWRARLVEGVENAALAALLGVDRGADFTGAEAEDADILIAIDPAPRTGQSREQGAPLAPEVDAGHWTGLANRLDPHPLYRWPVIDEVSVATQGVPTGEPRGPLPQFPPSEAPTEARAANIILNRRSAQRFDAKFIVGADCFYRLLDRLLARPGLPWDVWSFGPRLHPILFVHRVEGLSPGVYALPRSPDAAGALRAELRTDFEWQHMEDAPAHLPLFRLLPSDCRGVVRTASCHQAIASDSCFSLSMLSEFEPVVRSNPWHYRQLHWEAGLLGHVLYLEAEAEGLRGTGIGCFFDDAVHSMLGLQATRFQALYHFTVGRPLTDDRITSSPAYPGRQRNERWDMTT